MIQPELVLTVIGVNVAIALICGLCAVKLMQLRQTIGLWNQQIVMWEQELQQELPQVPADILAGRQQLQQARQQWQQLQQPICTYYQWSREVILVLQWIQRLKR